MRVLKLTSSLLAILALTAIGVAAASAAETLWLWLPGAAGTAFTASGGESFLETVAKTKTRCGKVTGTGELTTEKTLGKATLTFTDCEALSFPVNSLGAAAGTIVAKVALHNCIIAETPELIAGILFKTEEVHTEIPVLAPLLINVIGSFVTELAKGQLKKLMKPYNLNIVQAGGKQKPEKCLGGTKDTALEKLDASAFEEAGLEIKGAKIEFIAGTGQEALA